ncbi:hypothetical protein THRCLA_06165 [Thraustotheca clavata]|uniref:Secreted protein n=1 Tax=Thraustotheca clavata TaxID=74557 RepID=A0A0A7CLG0_9STRA|nr:secreted protein [Thraustotheca clavata]OQS00189.1 hypothetical protein THRCLA_06165 [Thraustotheca clavata]
MLHKGLFLSLLLASGMADSTYDYPSFEIPAFDLDNLYDADTTALLTALKTNGIINIKNIQDFDHVRSSYMEAAANCIANTPDFPEKLLKTLRDNTIKETLSTSVQQGVAATVAKQCPDYAAFYAKYSALLDLETLKLANILDAYSNNSQLTDVAKNGMHLDHFHAYSNPDAPTFLQSTTTNSTVGTDDLSLEMHEDSGILLETSEPLFFDRQANRGVVAVENPDKRTGLIIELHGDNNRRVRPQLKRDELTIMIGQGFRDWGYFGLSLPAVNHGMIMPRNAASSVARGFSGRMLLLHGHAKMANTGLTFHEYGRSITRHLMQEDDSVVSLACPVGRVLTAMDGACTLGLWTPTDKCGKTAAQCMFDCNNQHTMDKCQTDGCCTYQGNQNNGIDCWMVCVAPLSPDVCAVQQCSGQAISCKTPATKSPSPNPAPQPDPTPAPGPSPNPSPQPNPSPSPGPAPQPNPTPAPQPNPSPAPGPFPSPSPQPNPSPTAGPQPNPSSGPNPSPSPQPNPNTTTGPSTSPRSTPAPGPSTTSTPTPNQTTSPGTPTTTPPTSTASTTAPTTTNGASTSPVTIELNATTAPIGYSTVSVEPIIATDEPATTAPVATKKTNAPATAAPSAASTYILNSVTILAAIALLI